MGDLGRDAHVNAGRCSREASAVPPPLEIGSVDEFWWNSQTSHFMKIRSDVRFTLQHSLTRVASSLSTVVGSQERL